MRNRLIVYLSPGERQLLQRMAIEDIRPPDDQIRYLIVNEAIKRGITENQSATGGSLDADTCSAGKDTNNKPGGVSIQCQPQS